MSALPKTWRTKDGRLIKIKDLEDDHLTNIIGHVRHAARMVAHMLFLDAMQTYFGGLRPSGDMAQLALEQEIADYRPYTEAEVLSTWPVWWALRGEADRRAAKLGLVPVEDLVLRAPDKRSVPRWAACEPTTKRIPIQAVVEPRLINTRDIEDSQDIEWLK